MDILDSIIWDMTLEPNTSIIWDKSKKDYKQLSVHHYNTKIGITMFVKCPIDFIGNHVVVSIPHNHTIGQIMTNIHEIYSNIAVINNLDGMTWFNGFSEIDYPNFVLNISK